MPLPSLRTWPRARQWLAIVMAGLTALSAMPAQASTAAGAALSHARPAPAGCTGPASATWLHVIVTGVRNAKGQIAITLYADDPGRFLVKHGSMYVGRTPTVAGTTESCIYVPHPGVYVLAVYHDEDGDGKFGRTGIGLPAEGYGFSNNPNTLFGLPSFQSVRLNVTGSGLTSHIQLTYP